MDGTYCRCWNSLSRPPRPHCLSSWWSVVSESADQPPRIVAWLSKYLYLNDMRDVQWLLYPVFPPSGRPTPLKFYKLFWLCFRGSTLPSVRKPLLMLTLYCSHRALTLTMAFLFSFSFLAGHQAWGILVPRPGIEPVLPTVEAQSPNHWTARGFPAMEFQSAPAFQLGPLDVCELMCIWGQGGVTPLKEISAGTLLCFCWILINYCHAFTRMGESKETATLTVWDCG